MRLLIPSPHRIAVWLVLAAVSLATIFAITPPPPVPATAPPSAFASGRAMEHVRAIAEAPHPVGSPAHARVREYIVERLFALGLEVRVDESAVARTIAGSTHGAARLFNVAGRLRGTGGGRALLLAAHYDSVPGSRGASDDGAGVATLLETARALRAAPVPTCDVIFLFTDAEELGLLGATAFVDEHPWRHDVALVLNFEARGSRGASAMYESSDDNGRLIAELARAAPYPTSSSLVATLAKALPNDTDFTVFRRAGIPGYSFAFADALHHYHSYADSADNLDERSLQHHGSYAVALARRLGALDLDGLRAPQAVHFDLFGRALVRYPTWAAAVVGVVLAALWVAVVVAAIRRGALVSARAVAGGAGLAVAAVVGAAVVVGVASRAMVAIVGFDLAVVHAAKLAVGYVALALLVVLLAIHRARSKRRARELAAGACLLFAISGLLTGVFAPGASYPFQVPLLFVLPSFAAATLGDLSRTRRLWLLTAGAVPAAVVLPAVAYTTFVLAGATTPPVPALVTALAATLLAPHVDMTFPSRGARTGAPLAAFAIASLALAAPRAKHDPQSPRAHEVVYFADADSGAAMWIALGDDADDLDAWTARLLGERPERSLLPTFSRRARPLKHAPAKVTSAPPPELEVLRDRTEAGVRTLAFRVRSLRGARCLHLWEGTGAAFENVRFDGKPVGTLSRFSPETDKRLFRFVTGDTSLDTWNAEVCALRDGALEVELEARASSKLRIHVVDATDGFPDLGAPLPPLPPGTIAGFASDRTLVGRVFTL